MKRLLLAAVLIVLAALAAFPGVTLAQATDPAAVMGAFNDAATEPDTAITYLADDVVIRVLPPPAAAVDADGVWTGLEEARAFLMFTKAQNVKRELVGSWQVSGNTVTGTVMVTANALVALGVAPVEHTLEAVVEDGKIKTLTSTMTPSEQARVGAAAAAAAAAGQPPMMPATGAGAESNAPNGVWLWAVGVIVLALGLLLRRAQTRAS